MNDETQNNQENQQGINEAALDAEESVTLETGRPAVASAPGKIMVFVIFGLVCVAIVVKSLFFSAAEAPVENKVKKLPESVSPASVVRPSGISPGELPQPPQQDNLGTYSTASSSAFSAATPPGPDLSKLPPPPQPPATPGSTAPTISMPSPPALNTPGASPSIISAPSTPSLFTAPAPTSIGSAPGALPPPAPPPDLVKPSLPDTQRSLPKDEATMKRIQSEMVVSGGNAAAAAKPAPKNRVSGFTGNDPNSQFAQSAVAAAHKGSVEAERIEDLQFTLIEGKIVHGVLETAINSDLPGTLRALVSHDVYAEAGRAILIPKGSRIIGTYNAAVKRGQGRVFIIWTRVIRPDGITIDVDAPGVDDLGRAGLDGDVDNKYFDMFSTALLTSSLDIGVAAVGQALFGDDQSSTTTNTGTGGTTSTSSATGRAMQEAVDSIGSVGKSIVNTTLNIQPTITVDQGTPVNIFVNKELVFPPYITQAGTYFIQ